MSAIDNVNSPTTALAAEGSIPDAGAGMADDEATSISVITASSDGVGVGNNTNDADEEHIQAILSLTADNDDGSGNDAEKGNEGEAGHLVYPEPRETPTQVQPVVVELSKAVVRVDVDDLLERRAVSFEQREPGVHVTANNSTTLASKDVVAIGAGADLIAVTEKGKPETLQTPVFDTQLTDGTASTASTTAAAISVSADTLISSLRAISGTWTAPKADSTTASPMETGLAPTPLGRGNRLTRATRPGAVAIISTRILPRQDLRGTPDLSTTHLNERATVGATTTPSARAPLGASETDLTRAVTGEERDPEALVTATLVDGLEDDGRDLVEAEPALEGIAAMYHNRYFKHGTAAVLLVVIVAVTVPLVILLPGSDEEPEPEIIVVGTEEDVLQCGTRAIHQADYRGSVSVTEMGIECQPWGGPYVHTHGSTPDNYPDADLRKNFCRNPCGNCEPRAWCYTTDPKQRWAYCDVEFCGEDEYEFKEECGTVALAGNDYRGNVSKSATGKTCLPWAQPFTQNTPENRPNAGLEDGNYCRNPDSTFPYCTTNDPENRQEFCDLPQCGVSVVENSTHIETCKNCTTSECGTPRHRQVDYRGTTNTTISGLACIYWDDTSFAPSVREKYGMEENYCRNPVSSPDGNPLKFPWCYVDAPDKRKEFCDVPRCEDEILFRRFCGSKDMSYSDYRGDVKVTESGNTCQFWVYDQAVLERNTPFDRLWDGLAGSYCRNPGGERAKPWCYVAGAETGWEYCNVETCTDCGTARKKNEDYTGLQSQTRSGKTCVPWENMEHLLVAENSTLGINITISSVIIPHQFGIRRKHNLEENYCRNPLPYQRETVFCFVDAETGDWEYCDVPECEDLSKIITSDTCGSQSERQSDYRGEINETATGRPCVPWDLQDTYTPDLYPDLGLEGAYCRQPASSGRVAAWCYVNATEMTWEYCSVAICEESRLL